MGGSGAGVQGLSRLSLLAMNWFDLGEYGPRLTDGVAFVVGMCFFFLFVVVVLLVRTYHQKRKRIAWTTIGKKYMVFFLFFLLISDYLLLRGNIRNRLQ